MRKNNDARVSMRPFLDLEFTFVSAVLHAAVDCVNRPRQLGDDFSVLHNPLASHPLNPSTFDWCDQYFYRDGVLDKRLANSAWPRELHRLCRRTDNSPDCSIGVS